MRQACLLLPWVLAAANAATLDPTASLRGKMDSGVTHPALNLHVLEPPVASYSADNKQTALLRALLDLEEQTSRERARVKNTMASIAAQVVEANKTVALALQLMASPGH